MRRRIMAALVGAALSCAAAVAPGISAAKTAPGIVRDTALLHSVQYFREQPYGGGWERRHERRARDEARIAAAARREAYRIHQERAQRRAWRHAQRDRHGYYRGF